MDFLTGIWGQIAALIVLVLSAFGAVKLYGSRREREGREEIQREERERITEAERTRYEMDRSNRNDDIDSLRERMRKFRDKV